MTLSQSSWAAAAVAAAATATATVATAAAYVYELFPSLGGDLLARPGPRPMLISKFLVKRASLHRI